MLFNYQILIAVLVTVLEYRSSVEALTPNLASNMHSSHISHVVKFLIYDPLPKSLHLAEAVVVSESNKSHCLMMLSTKPLRPFYGFMESFPQLRFIPFLVKCSKSSFTVTSAITHDHPQERCRPGVVFLLDGPERRRSGNILVVIR